MRRIICKLAILFAWNSFPIRLFAAPEANRAPEPLTARVAFTAFSPWSFKGEGGKFTGILVDYLRDVAKEINLNLQEEDVPIARLHHGMSQGRLDIFLAKAAIQPLECCVSVGKVFDSETLILRLKSGPAWDPEQAGGRSICRVALSTYSIRGFTMFDADSADTCVRMMVRGRLTYMIGERYSLSSVLQSQSKSISDLFAEPILIDHEAYDLFITKRLDQSPYGAPLRKSISQRKLSDYVSRYMAQSSK